MDIFDLFNENNNNDFYNDSSEEETFFSEKELKKIKIEKQGDIVYPESDDAEETFTHFKRYTKRREHKYTEKEIQQIKDSCKFTIVHDYSVKDIFHMSNEERDRNDLLREISVKLSTLKRIYRRVDQYIEAMRIVVRAWEILEEKDNYLYTKDEFYELVGKGRIYNNRIILPKLKGNKNYDMDTIIMYISNPQLDPADLMPSKVEDPWDDFYDDEKMEDEMERLLSPEEVQYIIDNADNPPEIDVEDIKPKDIRGYKKMNTFRRNKNKKKLSKKEKYRLDSLHDILNKIEENPSNRNYENRSFLITNNLFEVDKDFKSNQDEDLFFDGSWADDDAVELYNLYINEKMMNKQIPGTYITYEDKKVNEFFKIMEKHGMNVLKLRRAMNRDQSSLQNIENRESRKNNRKLESAILQRLTKLNQDPKFKKLAVKAEKDINKFFEENN